MSSRVLQGSLLDLVLLNIFINELDGGLEIMAFGLLRQHQICRDYLKKK